MEFEARIDVQIEVDGAEEYRPLIKRAARAALAHSERRAGVSVLVTDEQTIRRLNAQFRGIDKVTDVLSFATWEEDSLPCKGHLGDIAICLPRAIEQAEAYDHSLTRELAFLTAHGCLHLAGYDHQTPTQEKEMFALQERILTEIGYGRHGGA